MSLNSPLLSRVIAAAVNISQKSGTILRDIKSSGELNIKEKEKDDYVTRADFLSQLNIIKSLQHSFPKLQFCGEEGVRFLFCKFCMIQSIFVHFFLTFALGLERSL